MNQEGEGLGLSLRLRELDSWEAHLDRSRNWVTLALVTLGLYIAGSLLMLHSIGLRIYDDVSALAVLAYALALLVHPAIGSRDRPIRKTLALNLLLEPDFEYRADLMPREIDEIERARIVDRLPGHLGVPCQSHLRTFGKDQTERRTDEERVAGESIEGSPLISA